MASSCRGSNSVASRINALRHWANQLLVFTLSGSPCLSASSALEAGDLIEHRLRVPHTAPDKGIVQRRPEALVPREP